MHPYRFTLDMLYSNKNMKMITVDTFNQENK